MLPETKDYVNRLTRWKTRLLGCALILATFVAYIPAIRGGFIWDDEQYVTDNLTLRTMDGLRRIWFELRALPQYYPMVHSTFWLEYHLWGLNPLGYHLINVLLHSLNALLLWHTVRKLGAPGGALAAVIFALHPVHVESVAWITERKNVLSTLFYLLSLLAYFRFKPLLKDQRSTGSWSLYALSLGLFLCALLSKTVTCSLPAAILLLLWWKEKRVRLHDILPLIPMFVLGAAFGLLTARLEKHHVGAVGDAWSLNFAERCLIAGRALWFYTGKLLWPTKLTFIYPRWQIDMAAWWQYLFPLGALAVVLMLWLLRKRIGNGPLVGSLFFGGALFPALGFFNVYPMLYSFVADHFQYLASMGLIVLFAHAFWTYRARLPFWRSWVDRATIAVILLTLGTLVWRQGFAYKDLETLWRDTIEKNPSSWMAHLNLGVVLAQQGKVENAIAQYHEALRLRPFDPDAHYDLGNALVSQGNIEEAIKQYGEALRFRPIYLQAQYNMGVALARLDRFHEAVIYLKYANQLDPQNPGVHHMLALSLAKLGKIEEAIDHHSEAIRLKPKWAPPINDLAWMLATHVDTKFRNGSRAVQLAEEACALTKYQDANYLDTLAAAYAEVGRFNDATRTCKTALDLVRSSDQKDMIANFEKRLQSYLEGRPYRETQPSPTANP